MSTRKDWQVIYAQNGLELVRYEDGRRELRLSESPEVILPVVEVLSVDEAFDAMFAAVMRDESRTN
jgi:hypothetical protein